MCSANKLKLIYYNYMNNVAVEELKNACIAVRVNSKLYKNIPYAATRPAFGSNVFMFYHTFTKQHIHLCKSFAIAIQKNEAFVICHSFL